MAILAVIAILFFDKLNTAFSIDAVYVAFLVATVGTCVH